MQMNQRMSVMELPCVLSEATPSAAEMLQRQILATFNKPRFSRAAANQPADGSRTGARPHLWKLETMFHCPIIGTCLSMQELRRFARRARVDDAEGLSDYALHSIAVNHATKKSPFSEIIQKGLERKYQADIGRIAAHDNPDDLLRYWNEQLAAGDVAGAFWALVTHAAATPSLVEVVYRDVHMLSHQVGAGQRANLRRQKELGEENARLRDSTVMQQTNRARQFDEMREALACSKTESARARQVLRDVQAPAPDDPQARPDALEDQLAQLRRHAAEQGLRALSDSADEAVDMPDLAGCDLLCVGGRVNLQEHYRTLVERCNGRFNYHDGGFEDGALRLHGLLHRADAVICPADCVSHPMYHEVKRLCKRTGKPCVLLSNSGLASFTRGLRALAPADGEARNDAVIISL